MRKNALSNNTQAFKHKYTKKPILEACCSFKFRIIIDKVRDVYYIKSGTGNNKHEGHPELKKSEVNPSFKTSDEKVTTNRNQLCQVLAPPSVTRRVLHNETGFNFTRAFLHRNITEQMEALESVNTSADNLLRHFRQSENIKFVFLFDDLQREELHTVPRYRQKKKLTLHVNDYNNQENTSVHDFHVEDEDDEAVASIEVNSIR